MDYNLTDTPDLITNDCLVAGVFSKLTQNDLHSSWDPQICSIISPCVTLLSEPGDITWRTTPDNKQLLIIQCGDESDYDEKKLAKYLKTIANSLINNHIEKATLCLPTLKKRQPNWQLQYMLLKMDAHFYQMLDFKSINNKPHSIKCLNICLANTDQDTLTNAVSIAAGIRLARDLANMPANVCTPAYLVTQARTLADQYNCMHLSVFHREDLQAMNMWSFLAVAQGSHEPPALIELHYRGAAADVPPIVLVGKGITFDSGGISLKSPAGMNEMKYDMAGAASVLGTLSACAALKLPLNIIGLMACAENMPGGGAVKPGDIVRSRSGQTIEITNTDAEGRLVLADTLTYAEQFKPAFVLDIATLTGAVIMALGAINTGFMTEDEDLAHMLESAGQESRDQVWRLPLEDAYQEDLNSPLADMLNSSESRTAGSTMGACFLARFTKKYRWAHLDIAGTAWVPGKNNNATGRPVALLVELLRQAANAR